MSLLTTRLTAVVLALYLLFGQRFTIGAATGGRGTVSVLELLFVVVAAGMWLLRGAAPALERPRFLPVTVGPLFVLLTVLPLAGVLLGEYELRTMYTVVVVLVPLAFLAFGEAAVRHHVSVRRAVLVAIVGHGVYGLCQQLYRVGVMPSSAWSWAVSWDMRSQSAYDELYILSARSTGLFINPNAYGLWSVLAVAFGAMFLRGWSRVVAVGLGIVGVVGSQSRTAFLALALLTIIYLGSVLSSPRAARAGGLVAFALVPIGLLLWVTGTLGRLVEQGAQTRLLSGIAGLTNSGEDANLVGRYEGWARAQEFVSQYTVGTLGPPQLKFGGSIDNQFVSYYVQGGPLLVAAFLVALAAPILVLRRWTPQWWKLAIMSAVIAVFSYTGNPMDSPMTGAMVWLAAAVVVGESVGALAPEARSERRLRTRGAAHSAPRPRVGVGVGR